MKKVASPYLKINGSKKKILHQIYIKWQTT